MDTFRSQRLAHHSTDLVGESQLDGSGPPGRLEAWIYLPALSPLALSEILGTFVKVFERKIRLSLHSHGPGHQGYASILVSPIVKLLHNLFEKIPPVCFLTLTAYHKSLRTCPASPQPPDTSPNTLSWISIPASIFPPKCASLGPSLFSHPRLSPLGIRV